MSDKTTPSELDDLTLPKRQTQSLSRNARWGLFLFAVYLLFYTGFVLLNAFAPSFMERDFFAGINIAVGYGLALIVAALALALFYGWLCRE